MPPMRSASRVIPAAAVLGVAAIAFAAITAVAYNVGIGTESACRFFDPGRAPNANEAVCACKIEYALHSRDSNHVVFIGDSSGLDGVDPVAFERTSGHRACNLCSEAGLGPIGYFLTLQAYLQNHPRPQGVVLCVTPITFEHPVSSIGAPDDFIGHYGHDVGMYSAMEDLGYFTHFGAARLLYGRSADVRDLPLTLLEAETYHSMQRHLLDLRGWCKLPGEHGGGAFESGRPPGSPTEVIAEWDSGVRKIRSACAARKIPLWVRFMPLRDDLRAVRDFRPLLEWARRFEADDPTAVVSVLSNLLWYEPRFLWDAVHLNATGAKRFSEEFGADLRGPLGEVSQQLKSAAR
jgi:hypothetical protein